MSMNKGFRTDEQIAQALRRRGYKATPQRVAICRLSISSPDHPTAQRIYKEVREQYPTVSLATVYKTLDLLKKLRLVQELPIVDGDTRFDSKLKPHLNLVCQRCGKVLDVDSHVVQETIANVARTAKFDVRGVSLAIYGVCRECGVRTKTRS